MKKTTIIVICVVYLLSILAVQFFGIPYSFPESGEYIESIQIESVSLSKRSAGQSTNIECVQNDEGVYAYLFNFIEASPGAPYTKDADSLESNPNRVKITYKLLPEGVGQAALKIIVSEKDVVVLNSSEENTYELVFLKNDLAPDVIIKETKGADVGVKIIIFGSTQNS